jgi:hypothetical protein
VTSTSTLTLATSRSISRSQWSSENSMAASRYCAPPRGRKDPPLPWWRRPFCRAKPILPTPVPGSDNARSGIVSELGDILDLLNEVTDFGATPEGRPYTKHYDTETGPQRNIR